MRTDRCFVAVDWGNSNFRAYLLGQEGSIIDERALPMGVKILPRKDQPGFLASQIAEWIATHKPKAVLLFGMVGSELGLKEVPMRAAPIGLDALASHLSPLQLSVLPPTFIVPGISAPGPVQGMMRGEEVLTSGALILSGQANGELCLPGTHSKWVHVENGMITSIRTQMTGELFALVREHSMLSASLDRSHEEIEDHAFAAGVELIKDGVNILEAIFSLRSEMLHGTDIGAVGRTSKLSGLLIGAEIRAVSATKDEIYLVADSPLAHQYEHAFQIMGRTAKTIETRAAMVAGIISIFASLAL